MLKLKSSEGEFDRKLKGLLGAPVAAEVATLVGLERTLGHRPVFWLMRYLVCIQTYQ